MSVVGFYSEKGLRKTNQDRGTCIAINACKFPNTKTTVRAMQIYDGNNVKGDAVATVANEIGLSCLYSMMSDADADIAVSLNTILQTANSEIFRAQKHLPFEKMSASTGTIAVVKNSNELFISYVGDSGVIVFQENQVFNLVRDHSLANQLIDSGVCDEKIAQDPSLQSTLTKCLGVTDTIEPTAVKFRIVSPSIIVGGSDGAIRELGARKIRTILAANIQKGITNANALAKAISIEAIRQGSDDNSSVAVIIVPKVKPGTIQLPVYQPYGTHKKSTALATTFQGRG